MNLPREVNQRKSSVQRVATVVLHRAVGWDRHAIPNLDRKLRRGGPDSPHARVDVDVRVTRRVHGFDNGTGQSIASWRGGVGSGRARVADWRMSFRQALLRRRRHAEHQRDRCARENKGVVGSQGLDVVCVAQRGAPVHFALGPSGYSRQAAYAPRCSTIHQLPCELDAPPRRTVTRVTKH